MSETGFWPGLDVGFFCEKGDRKGTNEDAILIKTCACPIGELGLFVVADGVGGAEYGDTASGIVVDTMARWWDCEFLSMLQGGFTAQAVSESLTAAVAMANADVRRLSLSSSKGAGSTMSLLLLLRDFYIIQHIGDSRVYLLNEGRKEFSLLTEDHTYTADLVRKGLIGPDEARNHPRRNVITRCVGAGDVINVCHYAMRVNSGDIFMLCSDGFYNIVREEDAKQVILDGTSLTAAEKAAGLRKLAGKGRAYDNLSVILAIPVKKRGQFGA